MLIKILLNPIVILVTIAGVIQLAAKIAARK